MSISPYDFDTRFAPFEAFAPYTPVAPFALFGLLSAPVQWWMSAMLNLYGAFSEAAIMSMVYPFVPPHAAHALTAPDRSPTPQDGAQRAAQRVRREGR